MPAQRGLAASLRLTALLLGCAAVLPVQAGEPHRKLHHTAELPDLSDFDPGEDATAELSRLAAEPGVVLKSQCSDEGAARRRASHSRRHAGGRTRDYGPPKRLRHATRSRRNRMAHRPPDRSILRRACPATSAPCRLPSPKHLPSANQPRQPVEAEPRFSMPRRCSASSRPGRRGPPTRTTARHGRRSPPSTPIGVSRRFGSRKVASTSRHARCSRASITRPPTVSM